MGRGLPGPHRLVCLRIGRSTRNLVSLRRVSTGLLRVSDPILLRLTDIRVAEGIADDLDADLARPRVRHDAAEPGME